MEALRRSPQAVWNHYHHLYHSQETFQFWNLHLVPLKCSFENLNSDQSPKYFNFNLTDLYQCKLRLLQNKIYIKSFFVSEVSPGSIVGHWICSRISVNLFNIFKQTKLCKSGWCYRHIYECSFGLSHSVFIIYSLWPNIHKYGGNTILT